MEKLFCPYGTTLFFMEKLKPKTNSKLDPYLLFFFTPNYVNLKKPFPFLSPQTRLKSTCDLLGGN